MIVEAPMTSQPESVTAFEPEIDDLAPTEVSPLRLAGDPANVSSFPKVLRRRLDNFFADQNLSPKADRAMWVKIAAGLTVLAASWIALFALKPDSWRFIALY